MGGLGTIILVALLISSSGGFQQATTIPACRPPIGLTAAAASVSAEGGMSSDKQPPRPTTFREGEVIGLRLMQDGLYEEALGAFKKAMVLPGSRPDILRTANVSGPSPVGGSKGGTEGRKVQTLDEFEYQAAHYNMACAYAKLGNVPEAVLNLKKSFDYGFDNYATVRSDPDLGNIHASADFQRLMNDYDKKINPFGGFFGK